MFRFAQNDIHQIASDTPPARRRPHRFRPTIVKKRMRPSDLA